MKKRNRVKPRTYINYHQHTKDGVPLGQSHPLVESHKKPSTARAHARTVKEVG